LGAKDEGLDAMGYRPATTTTTTTTTTMPIVRKI